MLLPVLYALGAAISWGLADFGAGLKSRTLPLVVVMFWIQALGCAASGALVLATGAPLPTPHQALASLAAGAVGVAGLALFYRALATGTMSVVAPIGATGVALPVLVGVLGGDRLSGAQALGLLAAVLGVVAASRQAPGADGGRGSARRSVGLALLAALGFGGYFVASHAGVRGGLAWLLLLSHAVALVSVLAVAVALRAPLAAPRSQRASLLCIGVLDLSATALYGLANRHGLLSVVAVVGSLYPAATVVLARIALRERVGRLQAAGIGLALAGVGLIAGG
ncbi:MAG: EamA family transporter [Solirubrobacteraceae bacterium]